MAEPVARKAPLPERQDDLRQIKGIGPLMAQALNEAGIHRYKDLAGSTPDELTELLRSKVAFISAQRIIRDNWLGQARELAEQQAAEDPDDPPDAEDDPRPNPSHETWHELADFFVSFGDIIDSSGLAHRKTRVHYSQDDKDAEFDEIATDEMVGWMLAQGKLQRSAQPAPESLDAPVFEEPPIGNGADESLQPEIDDLQVSLIETPQTGARWVRVEASINCSVMDPILLAAYPSMFHVEILLVNQDAGEKTFVESASFPMAPEVLPYAYQHDLPVPPAGRYQLFLVARMAPPLKAYTLKHGPSILVEG